VKKRETAEMKPQTAPASVHIPQLIPTTAIRTMAALEKTLIIQLLH